MKRRISIITAVIVCFVFISMTSSDSTAQMRRNRAYFDTGVITLGPDQSARLSVAAGDVSGDGLDDIIAQKMIYSQGPCDNGVCSYSLQNTQITNYSVTNNETITVGVGITEPASGVRFRVISNNRNVKVNLIIFNATTGKIQTVIDINDIYI